MTNEDELESAILAAAPLPYRNAVSAVAQAETARTERDAARAEVDRLREVVAEAQVALDAVARSPVVMCGCGEGHRTCDCTGDMVRHALASIRALSTPTPAAPSAEPSSEYRRGYERAVKEAAEAAVTVNCPGPHGEGYCVALPSVMDALRSLLPTPERDGTGEEDPSGRDDPACDAAYAQHCKASELISERDAAIARAEKLSHLLCACGQWARRALVGEVDKDDALGAVIEYEAENEPCPACLAQCKWGQEWQARAMKAEADLAASIAREGEQGQALVAVKCELVRVKGVLEDFAEQDCFYADGCPTFGSNHGQCTGCRARAALAQYEVEDGVQE